MISALDGVILLQYELEVSEPRGNIGQMVRHYLANYDNFLREMERATDLVNGSLERNKYANLLYDSVWVFALALNSSSTLQCNDAVDQRRIVHDALKKLGNTSLIGATGSIMFSQRQVTTPVIVKCYRNE